MSTHYGLILTKNLPQSKINYLRGLSAVAIYLVGIGAICIKIFTMSDIGLQSGLRQDVLCDADECMAQGVECARELTLALDLLPLIFHSALITL